MLRFKNILYETPDKIEVDGKEYKWTAGNGFAFARSLKTGKLGVVSDVGETHQMLFQDEMEELRQDKNLRGYIYTNQYMFDAGRIFFLKGNPSRVIISMWPNNDGYYPSIENFKFLVKDLKSHFSRSIINKQQFDLNNIEVELPVSRTIVPAHSYRPEKARSSDVQAYQLHLDKNKGKKLRAMGVTGWGSDKPIAGKSPDETPAEFKYKYGGDVAENILMPPQRVGRIGITKFDERDEKMDQYDFLEAALQIGEAAIEESEASEKAKQMGLVHRGFGKYAKSKESPITHKTAHGRLIKYSDPGTEQDKPKKGTISGKTEKEKEEEKHHKKKIKAGLTNVKRIRSERGKAAFSFKYNGKSNEMVFTKGEYKLMVKRHINPSRIILARIEKTQEKKKQAEKGEEEKKIERRREYQQKKKELGALPTQIN